MVEACIKKVKQCFIYPFNFSDFVDYEKSVMSAIDIYNYEMPLDAINGRTPNEAFSEKSRISLKIGGIKHKF